MTIRSFRPSTKRPGELGVHSLDHFSLVIPKMSVAEDFYAAFGLDLKADGNQLGLTTFGSPHRWGKLTEGPSKKLKYVSYKAYEEDIAALHTRIESCGVKLMRPPPGFDSDGFWFADPDGILIEVKVAEKSSPTPNRVFEMVSVSANERGAPYRPLSEAVRPRRVAHIFLFTTNISRAIDFYSHSLDFASQIVPAKASHFSTAFMAAIVT